MTEKADAKTIGDALEEAAEAGGWTGGAAGILAALGYKSERTPLPAASPEAFFAAGGEKTKARGKLLQRAKSLDIVFQFTGDEVAAAAKQKKLNIGGAAFEEGRADCFYFAAADLKPGAYSRGDYAGMTREINKQFAIAPTVAMFRNDNRFTAAFTERRPNKRDDGRDVLGRVTMIKDIRMQKPHRAHLDILSELSLPSCAKWMKENGKEEPDFDGLHLAWLAKLDIEELNRKFYRELFNWFERAAQEAKFPPASPKGEQVIRLITRLLFVWFIKEKELVAEEWFHPPALREILKNFNNGGGDYYRAVLQNLFFATLNAKIGNRGFSPQKPKGHRVASLYRYRSLIADEKRFLSLMRQTPFVNGGLFDCLDDDERGGTRIDMFSDPDPAGYGYARKKAWENLRVPDELFFGKGGLIPILQHYKFTVEENTPVEQDVALDPELLGNVFELLLAEYIKEQTGSYYTPRAVVDYMADEALTAALAEKCKPADGSRWRGMLRRLLNYADSYDGGKRFETKDARRIVRAVSELKILDPAIGSGAFPMGVLHKLTLALKRLDPENKLWKKLQKDRAGEKAKKEFDAPDTERGERLREIDDVFRRYRDSDYGRKLYLVQNCIFGADIQPIACQIAKLRFFISLAIEQSANDNPADNYGIKPLPNLETRLVAANSLLGIDKQIAPAEKERLTKEQGALAGDKRLTREQGALAGKRTKPGKQGAFVSPNARKLETDLLRNRERHFHATIRKDKLACRDRDKELRGELAAELKQFGFSADSAEKIARWDPYDQNASAGWFDSEYMFGVRGGFDIVIGNPPYVRQELIVAQKPALKERFGKFFTGAADLYTYFYRGGFGEVRPRGHLCFISSNKFMRAGYGKNLRSFLAQEATMRILVDFGELPVFGAGTDPAIVLALNALPQKGETMTAAVVKDAGDIGRIAECVGGRGFSFPISELSVSEWAVEGGDASRLLLKKIRSENPPLINYIKGRMHYGIKTGYNDAFVIDGETRQRLIDEDAKSADLIQPWLDGRDIKRWRGQWAGKYVLFVQHATDIDSYPAVKKHLSGFKPALLRRASPGADKWYALQAHIGYWRVFEEPKIVFNETSKELHAFVDCDRLYINKTGFVIVAPDNEFLLGVLNSSLMDWFYRTTFPAWGDPWKGGRPQFRGDRMKRLPLAAATAGQRGKIANRVKKIIAAKAGDAGADTSQWEGEIDRLVYNLYGLTEKEIALVEARHSRPVRHSPVRHSPVRHSPVRHSCEGRNP